MWAAGKRRRGNGRTVVSRKNLNYRNPKVFTKRYKPESEPKKINRKTVENILILIGILAVGYLLLFSKYFQVKDIIVEGNKTVSSESLITSIPKNANLLLLKTGPIKNELKSKYPQIKEIAFFKGLPDAVKIQIVERDESFVWQTAGQRYLVDPSGIVSRIMAGDETTTLPIVADVRNRPVAPEQYLVTPDFIAFINYINQHFNEMTNTKPTAFSIDETSYDLTVNTDSGIRVIFDSTGNASLELDNLKNILVNYRDKITEYVDLRVEGWGYYK